LVVNGGLNGTAGYSTQTLVTPLYGDMPYGMSLAAGPVGQPAIYDPNAPKGSRWSHAGLDTSPIPRLYHSSALLLPDATVLIAGSNPNVDVNTTTIFPTTYKAEIFYPPYFSATTRPVPTGVPSTISYGGNYFDVQIPASSFSGSSNDAAANTTVALIRPGWTTHAMNMGQRYLQLNNTYTVNSNGSITLHVAQAPPNPNIFQPGPAFVYVVVNGVPSNGTYVIVGSGQIETQTTATASPLPDSVTLASASGSADGSSASGSSTSSSPSSSPSSTSSSSHVAAVVGGIVGAVAVLGILGAAIGVCLARRRRAKNRQVPVAGPYSSYAMSNAAPAAGAAAAGIGMGTKDMRRSDSSAFVPLNQNFDDHAWNGSTASLHGGYRDDVGAGGYDLPKPEYMGVSGRGSSTGLSMDSYDPYAERMSTSTPEGRPHRY